MTKGDPMTAESLGEFQETLLRIWEKCLMKKVDPTAPEAAQLRGLRSAFARGRTASRAESAFGERKRWAIRAGSGAATRKGAHRS